MRDYFSVSVNYQKAMDQGVSVWKQQLSKAIRGKGAVQFSKWIELIFIETLDDAGKVGGGSAELYGTGLLAEKVVALGWNGWSASGKEPLHSLHHLKHILPS